MHAGARHEHAQLRLQVSERAVGAALGAAARGRSQLEAVEVAREGEERAAARAGGSCGEGGDTWDTRVGRAWDTREDAWDTWARVGTWDAWDAWDTRRHVPTRRRCPPGRESTRSIRTTVRSASS